ncbi:Zn-ribbon domain-containing OB-fold protein [Labrys wisconsinensis]|uniref:OB-fold protein n=1 Tax=Labrys wisconsinensis TaxID=425677 RepID=A0ABU0JID1_9HYPH|nr:OB-fold domain-containing protein [Labrys wisconsinensis]MDQ0474036.1 putative OB-fold protein [Labrys wisconsinensis]
MSRPLPKPSPWSAGYWQAAAERRFVLQECRACDRPIMYPKRACPHCLSDDLGWRASPGKGEIYSVTVQMAGPPTGFADRLPYVIAIIRLDEGVQLMSNLVGEGAADARCGDRVTVDFEAAGDMVLPVFRLDRGPGTARPAP